MAEPDDKEVTLGVDMTGDDLQIEMSPEVRAQMEADPTLAAAVKDMMAKFHQAHEAVKRGQYKTFDEAIEALTGHRPEKRDLVSGEWVTDPDASMHGELFPRDPDADDE